MILLKKYKPVRVLGPLSLSQRKFKAFRIRTKAALFYKKVPIRQHLSNGDSKRFPKKIANYSKGLPHNELGEVDLNAYNKYIAALDSGDPNNFENIPLGGARKLVNPQAAYAYELVGPDSHQLVLAPPPPFSSAQLAGEMVEDYWQALTRDVPFNEYETNPLTIAATQELSSLSRFRGPKINGQVTPQTLYRENLPGALVGPYVSQFLWKNIPYVGTNIVQRYRTTVGGDDHLTSYEDWLAVQNGEAPPTSSNFDPTPRYIRNHRDLGQYVHNDVSVESALGTFFILLEYGPEAIDPNNPYLDSDTQVGLATFGAPHALDFVTRAARPALLAAWFQKWLVHRRFRPEAFGGRIHNKLTGAADYPIHHEVLSSEALALTFERYGTYLLPQAYPEGSPTHPSYPAGHSSFIGATVTMLKAFFNESFVIPEPVVASSDGLSLMSFDGTLTIGGELNKLAYNISIGRDAAGVHYRSSGINGLRLGEAIAIEILRDYRKTYNEDFKGFTFTKFDGKQIRI
ncbi:vanadium-dependent haloperoxidase [Bacillus sp. FJAT-45350]|uniref:vanadium-dependent haloperoxidase n=1 Tax=Bacillus sp. FJAT-45350 TaxID=2011014 RepID=UPI00359C11D7